MQRFLRSIGWSLVFFSTICGILYNINFCNRFIGLIFWRYERQSIEELSKLNSQYQYQVLSLNRFPKSYERMIRLIKANVPYAPYEKYTLIGDLN